MTDKNQKKQADNRNTIGSVAIGVGAAALAGAAVAGAMILKDEKNRDKAKKILTNVKNQVTDYIDEIHNQTQDKKVKIEAKLAEGKEKIKKKASSTEK